MDKMPLLDIVIVGVPEVTLTILLALLLLKGKRNIKVTLNFIARMIVAVTCILTEIYFARMYFTDLLLCSICCNVTTMIIIKIVFKLNKRQAILTSFLSSLVLAFSDSMSIQFLDIITKGLCDGSSIYEYRILMSLPSRIAQIIVLIIIIKFDINLNNKEILNKEWQYLFLSQKINYIFLVAIIFLCDLLCISYFDVINKFTVNNINHSSVCLNIHICFLSTILAGVIVIIVFNRTIKYEDFKIYFNKSSEEVVAAILENSTYNEIHKYTQKFLREVHVAQVEKLYDFLNDLKNKYEGFDYDLDKNIVLADCDYTPVINLVEYLVQVVVKEIENNSIMLRVVKDDKLIKCNFVVNNSNDIQYKKLLSLLSKNRDYLKHKRAIEKALNISPELCYERENICVNINIPFVNIDITNC